MGSAASEIAIITVHGTGDTALGPDGAKWFQRGSGFIDRLRGRLKESGIESTVAPFLWSGANSAVARETAAKGLAKLIRRLARTHAGVHIVGHSHGGNVANDAAWLLHWRDTETGESPIRSLTTVGTPFFRSRVTRAEFAGGISFLFVLAFSLLALMITVPMALSLSHNIESLRAEIAEAERDSPIDAVEAQAIEARIATITARLNELQERLPTLDPDQPLEDVDTDAWREQSRLLLELGDLSLRQIPYQYLRERRERLAQLSLLERWSGVFFVAAPLSMLALLFVFPLAWRGWLRIVRTRHSANASVRIFSIWHDNDEAIAFLKQVGNLALEPFPRGALWRMSRTTGIIWGVNAVLLIVLLGLTSFMAWYALRVGGDETQAAALRLLGLSPDGAIVGSALAGMPAADWAFYFGLISLLTAPIVFAAVYLLVRLVMLVIAEPFLRGHLNAAVTSAVNGMALGRDSDERLGDVSTCSHTFESQMLVLDGDVARRMAENADQATTSLLAKYRYDLFSVDSHKTDVVSNMATDALTWDSLVHTTYFDQPEVADLIADYIAAQAQAKAGV